MMPYLFLQRIVWFHLPLTHEIRCSVVYMLLVLYSTVVYAGRQLPRSYHQATALWSLPSSGVLSSSRLTSMCILLMFGLCVLWWKVSPLMIPQLGTISLQSLVTICRSFAIAHEWNDTAVFWASFFIFVPGQQCSLAFFRPWWWCQAYLDIFSLAAVIRINPPLNGISQSFLLS